MVAVYAAVFAAPVAAGCVAGLAARCRQTRRFVAGVNHNRGGGM